MRIDLDASRAQIPYLANWFGVWAIHEPAARALASAISSISVVRHLASIDPDDVAAARERDYSVVDGIAVLNVDGPILKHRSSYGGSCSTVELRRLIRAAVADPNVDGICLRIESPGGSVAGTPEAFEELRRASAKKPTLAFADDLCASAGYWIACGCDRIVANESALVGSIGVYTVVADTSQAAATAGIAVHVIGTGEHKGAGEPGTEITEAHLAHWRTEVDGLNALFLRAVKTGRDFDDTTVSTIADGRCHLATDALSLGLVDAVGSFEAALADFRKRLDGAVPSNADDPEADSSADSTEHAAMPAETPATSDQLKARFPKTTAAWRLRCVERALTIDQAAAEYVGLLEARAEALQEKLALASKKRPGLALEPPRKGKTKPKRRHNAEDMVDDEELMEAPPEGTPEDMPEGEPEDLPLDEEEDPSAEDMGEEEDPSAEDMTPDEEDGTVQARFQRLFAAEVKAARGNRRKALASLNRKHPGLVAAYRKVEAARIERKRKLARRRAGRR